eukprot:1055171-Pyramimonas_sp.AAC.1
MPRRVTNGLVAVRAPGRRGPAAMSRARSCPAVVCSAPALMGANARAYQAIVPAGSAGVRRSAE